MVVGLGENGDVKAYGCIGKKYCENKIFKTGIKNEIFSIGKQFRRAISIPKGINGTPY